MGFSEIYLVGMDHNYICNKENNHRSYKNGIHQNNWEWKNNKRFFSN